ncbi:MAG: NADPH-dependent oxidoreductase [Aeromicrobium sp.]|nr:NADPH-dependent oxidoreductase [Aeromicrobium sp.]
MSTSAPAARELVGTVVVGNPKPRSRTWDAAHRVAEGLGASATTSIDLVDLGSGLLGWGDPAVKDAVARVAASDVVVVASPTFKATYTGLLKLFLDQFAGSTGLDGVVAVPLQLGGGPAHELSPELYLKPVLVELGAIVPAPALYLVDSVPVPDPVEVAWLERWGPVVRAAAGGRR